MAVTNAMFLFEVVVESVKSFVESRVLVIKSDFADIFSLELKDPKQMHIVMPEPPPLPPAPAGKKGKKKPPKPKKGKKGKKGNEDLPPPEPAIQSGQSVLFSSSAVFLIQNMKKFPLELSLWSKEDNLVFIGNTSIPWDEIFLKYLEKIYDCQNPLPAMVKDDYNIFEEGTAKLMAKLGIQVKLTYLTDKVTTAFRTLSEDPTVKKFLYTGINSKTTSYMCTLKTSDELYIENSNKIENNFAVDKPKSNKIAYADYKNAPGANLTFFNDGDYCCMGQADKPPESIYKAPETCPDIDFIVDYVRKIIVSCNDNMRMLTPQPILRPRIKATDIDRLCYCKETAWPKGELAERFKDEALSQPCPICIDAGKKPEGIRPATFDIANIRGPCGRADCRIARGMREYIENLVEEDIKEITIQDIIGPCGSKECTLAEKIQQFLRHEGAFSQSSTLEGLSTQCACLQQMQAVLTKDSSCDSACTKDCDESSSDASNCGGTACPYGKAQVYNVFYFTVEYDFEAKSPGTSSPESDSSKYKYCSSSCPSGKSTEKTTCSKSECSTELTAKRDDENESKCREPTCPRKGSYSPSPADSNVIIQLDDIRNACCLDSCDVAEQVKDFISDNVMIQKNRPKTNNIGDLCYCDCVCSFNFSKKTTYCAVCGGYECLGNDMANAPAYMKPQPCPVYHNLYDKNEIKVPNPWEEDEKRQTDNASMKSTKTGASRGGTSDRRLTTSRSTKSVADKKSDLKETSEEKPKKEKQKKTKVGKFTANVEAEQRDPAPVDKKPEGKYPYPAVPKSMGWNWKAEDIPGMKVAQGWKPGAISKRLLRQLNKAKRQISTANQSIPTKKQKKQVKDKPTLIISKKDGEYRVEMQATDADGNNEQYTPLIYKIARANNEDRIKKKERLQKRLIQKAVAKVWSDPYHPELCEQTCHRAYEEAIGLKPFNPNPDCTCSVDDVAEDSSSYDEDDISSECSSLDVDWEIQFSPPIAVRN